ncbi:hypothetical protein GP486_004970, partial [Trichoglossum hirsutum]
MGEERTSCLFGSPPDHPRALLPPPQHPLYDDILLHLPVIPGARHHLPVGGIPRQTLGGLDPHDSLTNASTVDRHGGGAVGDHAGRSSVAAEGPDEALSRGAREDAGAEVLVQAGGGDGAEGFNVTSSHDDGGQLEDVREEAGGGKKRRDSLGHSSVHLPMQGQGRGDRLAQAEERPRLLGQEL